MSVKIVIVGTGPGGYAAAVRAASLGAEVTVIDKGDVGGTCLNRGCIPSKIFITAAEIIDNMHKASKFGIPLNSNFTIDLNQLIKLKYETIQDQIKGIISFFQKKKIRFIKGFGQIADPNQIIVAEPDGKKTRVMAHKIILALGTIPANISDLCFDHKNILSSNDALNLDKVPESILIVGGGVIGCEFASIFSSFGTDVTIVESMPRLLPISSIDEESSKVLLREMKKRKIDVKLNQKVQTFEIKNSKIHVKIKSPSAYNSEIEKAETFVVDKMLVCIGRSPDLSGTGIEQIGVSTDSRGWLLADQKMKTNIDNIYAVGDILGPSKIMLAHVASMEGVVAAENAMGKNRIMDYDVVPVAIFTKPEVASVGLTCKLALEKGIDARSDRVLFRSLGKSHVIREIAGHVKIVSDRKNGKIVGVHMIGAHATELIAEGALAVKMKSNVKELAQTIHAHPTLAEAMKDVAMIATGS